MVYSAYSLYKNACHYFALEVTRHPAMSPKRILNVDLHRKINDRLSAMALISFSLLKVRCLIKRGMVPTYGYFNKGAAKTIYLYTRLKKNVVAWNFKYNKPWMMGPHGFMGRTLLALQI